MSPSAPDKSTIDRLLDAGVFTPLGYVLRRHEVRKDLAVAGRKQVAFARSLGRAALKNIGRGVGTPKGAAPAPTAPPEPALVTPEPAPASETVPGYSDMTAKDIVAFLRTATVGQAHWVVAEESAGKGRVTVLRSAAAMTEQDD